LALSTVVINRKLIRMARQTTLNVSLTPKLRNYVRSKVHSGTYESASEVIRESLRALQEREKAAHVAFWHGVREKVAVARREVAQGRGLDGEAVMADIIAEAGGAGGGGSQPRRGTRKTSKRARR
jgi:antitoxin ParD1/3/4